MTPTPTEPRPSGLARWLTRTTEPPPPAAPSIHGLRRGPKPRRSPIVVLLAVVMVCGGALGSVSLYRQIGQTQEVVAITQLVLRGEQIERGDLSIVQARLDPSLRSVPATGIDQVVGQYARYDLVPGTTLSPGAVGEQTNPPEGFTEVGLVLSEGRYPDHNLQPADKVLLIGSSSNQGEPEITEYDATLVTVIPPDSSGEIRLTVLVPRGQAGAIATTAAAGRMTLALVSRGGR